MALISILFLVVYTLGIKLKRFAIFLKFWNNFHIFAAVGFPFWYLIEIFFKILITLSIEYLYLYVKRNWDLSNSIYKWFLFVSFSVFILITMTLLLLIFFAIWKYWEKSKFLTIIEGLNNSKWAYSIFYFLHFFYIRISISILILLSGVLKS